MQKTAKESFADENYLYRESVQLAKGNVFLRIVAPCIDEEGDNVDLDKLRNDLTHYKPADITGDNVLARSFSKLLRQYEQQVVSHLNVALKDEHKDSEKLADMLDKLDVTRPLQGAAPVVQVEVAAPSASKNKNNITLATFDSLKEQVQSKLLLRADTHGRQINPNTNTVWHISSTGHRVCVGHADGPKTLPLTPEDIDFCKKNGFLYDTNRVENSSTSAASSSSSASVKTTQKVVKKAPIEKEKEDSDKEDSGLEEDADE